ncbi:MAG: BatA domain-containing protein [Bacteroidota bacterium]|nr:BatA domain-containing protein [Bacteroidota bacterium]
MTFLNPLVLFGLIGAAIPLIIHLLNLRKLRTIEFSTLTFLKELQQTKIRRLKLKQILLLIIRTLMVILIVLAFSRPALRGTILGGIGAHSLSTVLIILDDSFSMMPQDEEGELFKQSKESALKILDLMKEGDEIYIIKLSNPESGELVPSNDIAMVKTAIRESQISQIRNPIEPALRLASKILSKSKNANKEIYIISDFQKTLFEHPDKLLNQTASLFDEDTKFFLIEVGKKEIQNVGIDSIIVLTKIFEKNKPVNLTAVIKNYGSIELKNVVASLYFDGVRVAQSSLDLGGMGTATANFSAVPKRTGFLKGYVELETDALEFDNRRFFTINVPEKISITFISNPDESRFVKLALTATATEYSNLLFEINEFLPSRFPVVDLKKTDVLVISNFTNISQSDVQRIKLFVEQRKGLILFAPENAQLQNFNGLLSALNIPLVESIGTANFTFKELDFDHPIFDGMFTKDKKEKERRLDSPEIYTFAKRPTGREGHSIISMSNGNPFLTEHKFGNGTVILYSISPKLSWSNFPLKGIFAPIIYRSVHYTAANEKLGESVIVGKEISIKLSGNKTASVKWKLIAPDASEEIISTLQKTGGGSDVLHLGKLIKSGIYELTPGASTEALLAVNVDKAESDLRKIPKEEMSGYFQRYNIQESNIVSITTNEKIQETVLATRFGVELWKYAVIFVLFLALLEMFIAYDRRKEK